jgi:hypothetical protein
MKRFKNLGLWALIVMIPVLALSLFAGPAIALTVSIGPKYFSIVGATLGANMVTMADYAKLLGPDDKLAPIIEMLNVKNSILDDIPWQEGNMTTGHRVVVRTGLPAVVFRLVNQGVPPSKSTAAQLDEQAARLEAWNEVDEMIAELASDLNQFRLSQALPYFESMRQTFTSKLFYGNFGLAPEEFTGLSLRFSTSVAANAASAQNVIKAGGAGADNTSIWLINWGPGIFGIYPKGTRAGLEHNDFGKETVESTAGIAGNRLRAYREQFIWRAGIAVPDWRSVVRIANVDVSDLVADTAGATVKLIEYMSRAIDRIGPTDGKLVFYASRTVKSILRVQALNKSTNALSIEGGLTQFGQAVPGGDLRFLGIPVRTVDAILGTEAVVP